MFVMEKINLKELGFSIRELYQYDVITRMNDHNFTLVRVKDVPLEL